MKRTIIIAVALSGLVGGSAAFAQGGDNPGGRGVTSTGEPTGVTGKEPNGKQARPVTTTGSASPKASGNTANSMSGPNSPSGSPNGPSNKASSAGGGEK